MKKLISIFLTMLLFSAVLFFASSGAKASSLGEAKKGLDSILHLKAPGPQGQGNIPTEGKNYGTYPLPEVRIPLSKNLKAYLGIVPPPTDTAPLDSGSDVRAAFGFHIPFK